jgi:predicted phosphodiesterase
MMVPRGTLLRVTAVVVLVFLGLWAFWWEPSSLTVVRRSVTVRPWHREHEGLKIAVISDLHVGSLYWDLTHFEEVVAAINAEHPDLLMILGDLVQGSPRGDTVQPEQIADRLAQVVAPLGRIAVLGNHDWWRGGRRVWRALESRGLRVLEDDNVRITHRGKSFWVSGLADLWTRGNQLEATLARIKNSDPVIVMMHEPFLFEEMPPWGESDACGPYPRWTSQSPYRWPAHRAWRIRISTEVRLWPHRRRREENVGHERHWNKHSPGAVPGSAGDCDPDSVSGGFEFEFLMQFRHCGRHRPPLQWTDFSFSTAC